MSHLHMRLLCFAFLLLSGGGLTVADNPPAVTTFLETHCVDCHGADGEGDVDLQLFASGQEQSPELIELVHHVIERHEMPPEEMEQPPKEARRMVASELYNLLAAKTRQTQAPRKQSLRRMNRFQYHNAVTDLFNLRCAVFGLPERVARVYANYFDPAKGRLPDIVAVGNRPLGKSQLIEPRLAGVAPFPQDLRAEHGFDTQADHLSLSPLLMESFLSLGQSIVQSKDFVKKNVGIWGEFFEAPEKHADPESKVIETRLTKFLTLAFRRPVEKETLDRYVSFVTAKRAKGISFEDSMKATAAAVIASPRFLYIYNADSQFEGAEALDPYSFASRLSFFLWGSIPDEQLLFAAEAGLLENKQGIREEVRRMLKSKKLKRFCDAFPLQWLQLDRMISATPDPDLFPHFYFSKYRLSMHMMLEPLLLFEAVLLENLPVTQFIHSDFTYRSHQLNKAYAELGLDVAAAKPTGPTRLVFERTLTQDKRSGGVITNAAVMTMLSNPERSQPISRGAWLASVVFNDPPKPPPADVPPLPEHAGIETETLTLRERLSAHRERADCRGCHEQIDPLGFALENYDAVGRWRSTYENGRSVNSSGKLFHQYDFGNITEFKEAILKEDATFVKAFAKHLLSFALGRKLTPWDNVDVEDVVATTAGDGYKIQSIIEGVVMSPAFRSPW
ncbi:MAG: DUF1592 domain-containing protein [Planctomycetaceae bacterium]|nr:DUF1592 domain-containing protein [Planctomycetaceae bacterium]